MFAARSRPAHFALAISALLLIAGCGKGTTGAEQSGGPAHKVAPVVPQGAVSVATRNTTRLGGSVVAADAASVARTVYPGLTAATRPLMVVDRQPAQLHRRARHFGPRRGADERPDPVLRRGKPP